MLLFATLSPAMKSADSASRGRMPATSRLRDSRPPKPGDIIDTFIWLRAEALHYAARAHTVFIDVDAQAAPACREDAARHCARAAASMILLTYRDAMIGAPRTAARRVDRRFAAANREHQARAHARQAR